MIGINELVQKLAKEIVMQALATGYLRYEHVRRMSPLQFKKTWGKSIRLNIPFDDLIDAEIERRANEK